jgi:hypothetical protein
MAAPPVLPVSHCNAYNGGLMRSHPAVMTVRGRRLLVLALAAAALAGCGGQYVAVGTAGAPSAAVVAPPGFSASISISLSSTAANILSASALIGFLAVGNEWLPLASAPMREDRTVNEQDCTKPIADPTANLKCR